MLNILIAILALGVLIGIHELSHMFTAKAFGVKVLKFSFGFGTRLLHRQIGETSYELRLLPLGGYVQFKGENPEIKEDGGFFSLVWYKRVLVALAGPTANLILGFLIIWVLFLLKDYPIIEAIRRTFSISSMVVVGTIKYMGGFFVAKSHVSDMSGPIAITRVMASSLKENLFQFFFILSVISLSLGLFNFIPLPALDGGHALLYTIEGLRKKPFTTRVYEIGGYIGFFLLAMLMVLVVYLDISKLLH